MSVIYHMMATECPKLVGKITRETGEKKADVNRKRAEDADFIYTEK